MATIPSTYDSDERSLLSSILADPDDDALRLVYADWLEERGDERADWVRGEVQVTSAEVLPKLPTREDSELYAAIDVNEMPEHRIGCAYPEELAEHVEPRFGRYWLATMSRSIVLGCGPTVDCPQRWSRLKRRGDPTVRRCGTCARPVFCCCSSLEGYCHALLGELIVLPNDTGDPVVAGSGFGNDDPEAFQRLQRDLGPDWTTRLRSAMDGISEEDLRVSLGGEVDV